MHTNFNLNYSHKIDFEVFHDIAPVTVEINFNESLIQTKTYAPGIVHKEVLQFNAEVFNGRKNKIQFSFTGKQESSKKYLKLKNISIQQRKISVLKNIYTPVLDKVWWNNLTKTKQKDYQYRIYINNNAHFGWYGNIEYEYYSAVDRGSAYLCDTAAEDRITLEANRFVYLDPNTIQLQWDKDEN